MRLPLNQSHPWFLEVGRPVFQAEAVEERLFVLLVCVGLADTSAQLFQHQVVGSVIPKGRRDSSVKGGEKRPWRAVFIGTSKGTEDEQAMDALTRPETMMMPAMGDWPKAITPIRLTGWSRFYVVAHGVIRSAMESSGIGGRMYAWLSDYLSDR